MAGWGSGRWRKLAEFDEEELVVGPPQRSAAPAWDQSWTKAARAAGSGGAGMQGIIRDGLGRFERICEGRLVYDGGDGQCFYPYS